MKRNKPMAIGTLRKKKLFSATILFWTLLTYIIAALIWWFISLNRQNEERRSLRIAELAAIERQPGYDTQLKKINNEFERSRAKYLGEGGTFLLIILAGAVWVYRAVRRQFNLQQQQQNFMMAVTHELKTPIAVVRLNLETLQKYNLDPVKQKKLLAITLAETSRLNFLTNNILVASELEGGGYQSNREDLDLSDLAKDCVQDFRSRFPDRVLETEIEADADVRGDALLLKMMINNLLENAIKYSSRDMPVTTRLRKQGGQIVLEVIDKGPGIADIEKRRIFEKFYRVGDESTRKTQGTGLGLYLCRKIARDHQAEINVSDNPPHGSIFAVIFHT